MCSSCPYFKVGVVRTVPNSHVTVFCFIPLVFQKSRVLRTVNGAAYWRALRSTYLKLRGIDDCFDPPFSKTSIFLTNIFLFVSIVNKVAGSDPNSQGLSSLDVEEPMSASSSGTSASSSPLNYLPPASVWTGTTYITACRRELRVQQRCLLIDHNKKVGNVSIVKLTFCEFE